MKLTAEERHNLVEKYAYSWWEIRCHYGYPGDEKSDYARAERMVANEERMERVK